MLILKAALIVSFLVLCLPVEANIKDLVDKMCVKHGATDCDLFHALVWQESRYKNDVVYDVDSFSFGPGQIKCGTAKLKVLKHHLKFDCDQLEDPRVSLRFAIYYLNYQLKRYLGDIRKAVSAYNMGKAHVCVDYNPGKCYPGEMFNYDYVNEVWRRYKWLRKEKQKQTVRFLPHYKKLDGLETSQTSTKWESQITLVATED